MISEDGAVPRRYWIGGGSGGGKSTVARALADRHDLVLYDTDRAMAGHAARTTPDDSPLLYAFMAMDMDERWAARDPAIMLDTFHWFRGEGFGLIVEDLAEIRRGTIVEGFRLLPHLVRPQLGEGDRAVWLLPTPEFRRHAFTVRGDLYKIAGRTRDPERALANLLERDALFTDRLAAEAAALDLPVIAVDGSRTLGELIAAVEATFDL